MYEHFYVHFTRTAGGIFFYYNFKTSKLNNNSTIQILFLPTHTYVQARAEGHSHTVVIVATHLDLIPKQDRERVMQMCKDRLNTILSHGRNMRGYPSVVSVQFVGCPSKNKNTNIDNLNEVIYKTACGMDSIRG